MPGTTRERPRRFATRLPVSGPRDTSRPADPRGHNGPVFSPSVENLVAQLTRLPGIGSRTAQRLAFHILQRPTGRGARARLRARGGQGARPLLPRVRQPDRGGALRDLHRPAPRPRADLRRRAAGRRRLARADRRVPRPLPRARRLALAARRRRPERPAHRRAAAPGRRERRARGRARDEPEHDRRGDRRLPRRPPTRAGPRHPPRERAARRRRPRVRRRGHPRPRPRPGAARCDRPRDPDRSEDGVRLPERPERGRSAAYTVANDGDRVRSSPGGRACAPAAGRSS